MLNVPGVCFPPSYPWIAFEKQKLRLNCLELLTLSLNSAQRRRALLYLGLKEMPGSDISTALSLRLEVYCVLEH